MKPGDRVYVAGHGGLVGSALVRRLRALGYGDLIVRTHAELELTDAALGDADQPCVFLMNTNEDVDLINVGVGDDLQIREFAELVRRVVGYHGTIKWDASQPDGTPRKLLDVSRTEALGWRARIQLEAGIRSASEWHLQHSTP